MGSHPLFRFFNLFLWILAVAAVPGTVYRGDTRSPADIKRAGGLKSRASTNGYTPKGTIFEHVEGAGNDRYSGFVSCTADVNEARKRTPNGWAYYINTSGGRYLDVAAEYARAKRPYSHASEQEWASQGDIPWSSITKWEKLRNKSVTSTETRQSFDNPSKIPKQPSGPPVPRPAPPKNQPPSKIPKATKKKGGKRRRRGVQVKRRSRSDASPKGLNMGTPILARL
jgi:hypothetical protein